jgi:hypothetical protein
VTPFAATAQASNPFATRYVRPGAIPYLFPAGNTSVKLVERFAALNHRAQILGPHGSGKSTLVASLLDPLAAAGRPAIVFALHNAQRQMPAGWSQQARAARARTIVVDGYEQLGRIGRWRLQGICRRSGWGLLVTAHADAGLPTLQSLAPDRDTVVAVVRHLMGADEKAFDLGQIEACFQGCGGNVRETLFALFDRHEQLRRRSRR